MEENKTKRNCGYRNVSSKNCEFTAHLDKNVNELLNLYCKKNGINKTKYVCECVKKCVEKDINEMYMNMSKEELINLLKEK